MNDWRKTLPVLGAALAGFWFYQQIVQHLHGLGYRR